MGNGAKRDEKGRFVCEAGPGRPPVVKSFKEACREFMERPGGGWERLISIAQSDKRDALRALELIAAYGYGKPAQAVELSGDAGLRIVISERVAQALEAGRREG